LVVCPIIKQEPWKAPLPEFIEHIYEKRFGKTHPDDIRSIEAKINEKEKRKAKVELGKKTFIETSSNVT